MFIVIIRCCCRFCGNIAFTWFVTVVPPETDFIFDWPNFDVLLLLLIFLLFLSLNWPSFLLLFMLVIRYFCCHLEREWWRWPVILCTNNFGCACACVHACVCFSACNIIRRNDHNEHSTFCTIGINKFECTTFSFESVNHVDDVRWHVPLYCPNRTSFLLLLLLFPFEIIPVTKWKITNCRVKKSSWNLIVLFPPQQLY